MGHHPFVGDRGRLLHHVAEVAREAQLSLARGQHRLHIEDVAAHLGPCEPRNDAHHVGHLVLLAQELGHAENLLHVGRRERRLEPFAESDLFGAGAGDLGQMLVERPHARLAGVARNDALHHLGRQRELLFADAVRGTLLGQQVVQRDADLLLHQVARDVDHLHAVAQRRGYIAHVVGRGDEEHFRQVVFHVEVVVVESRVLLRVEHLQQRARRIAVVRNRNLVHLVEDDDRIGRPAPLDGLDDAARHGADVGAAVSADLRLVVQTAQRDAAEFAAQRRGDRLAQRRLAHARRAVEAQDRGLEVAFELDDGQVFEQPVLHLLQSEVVVVEPRAGRLQIEIILRNFVPRQVEHQLQVGHLHRIFRHGGVEPLDLRKLLFEGLGHLLRPVLLGRLFAHLLDVGVLAVAQLVLYGAHLLLQIVVALLLVDLLLHALLNLALQLGELLLADQNLQQFAGSGQQSGRLQQRLPVLVR